LRVILPVLMAMPFSLASLFPVAQSAPLQPLVILLLCIVAGVGTVLLLPSRRDASLRKVGGVVLAGAGLVLAAFLVRWAAGAPGGAMNVYFWIFAAIAIVGSVRVITHEKPVYSALYFVLTVFATAGLFILMWAEFMAAALVLIYAGAILITYVFVIMLAAEAAPSGGGATTATRVAEHDAISREPVLACVAGFALMAVLLFVIFDKGTELARRQAPQEAAVVTSAVTGATQQLGVYLFRHHLVNLQLAGLILTVAMIGAIVISRRQVFGAQVQKGPGDTVIGPATPIDDNPHSIPVYGTDNPRQKAYPET
jgi:NADH-quinone oxidoreductase subunit J